MSEESYSLRITGAIISEHQQLTAIPALASILVLPFSEAQLLFSQAPVIVKENLTHEEALDIESKLVRSGIECQCLSATEVQSLAEDDSTHVKHVDASDLNTEEIESLSLTQDWTREVDDPSQHEAVEDVHAASHHGGDALSAYHLDDLSLEETPTGPAHATEQQPAEQVYTGPERRKEQRRKHDRREMIRFESPEAVKKKDRRKGGDRRKSESTWTKDHSHY